MSTLPDGITMADLRKLAKLDASIKKAEAMKSILADKVKAAITEPGTYVFEEILVDIQIPDVLDTVKFEAEKPQKKFPELYKVSPDTRKIQSEFGKKYYIKSGGSPRLSVKVTS